MSADTAIHAKGMSAYPSPARMTAMTFLRGGLGRVEERIGFAVIVEGIVYGVYSSAGESSYIADSIRASGLVCEICHYE